MNEPSSLSELFTRAEKEVKDLQDSSLSSTSLVFQEQLDDCLQKLDTCAALIKHLSIFSINEDLSDLTNASLRLLLVDEYRAELIQKKVGSDREAILLMAKELHFNFLDLCMQYLTDAQQMGKRFDALKEAWMKFELEGSIPTILQISRDERIARYRQEQELRQNLKFKMLQGKLSIATTSAKSGEDDELLDRDLIIYQVKLNITKALSDVEMIIQELPLVRQMKQHQGQPLPQPPSSTSSAARNGPLLNEKGKVLRTFLITSKREDFQNQVFRPGWTLPTMTIDEYLEEEMRRGNIIKGGGNNKNTSDDEGEDDEEAKEEAKTNKQRKWDDFKEANPKGWGNTMMNRG